MPRPNFRKKQSENSEGISKYTNDKISVGDIRKTQMITTFGVGAMVDFKDDTVIIASTDDWDYNPGNYEEVEKRQLYNENLSVITGVDYFLMPRTTKSVNSFSKSKDVPSYIFPEKLHCSRCGNIYDINELDIRQRHKCPQCKNDLTASRFVVVCRRGHLDDFPYDWWVHNGQPCQSGKLAPRIKMINVYNRTDIDSLMLECAECKARRGMVQAFSGKALESRKCTCKFPHFKDPLNRASYGCSETMITRLRTASGVYFPVTRAALLIPPWSREAVVFMKKSYDMLINMDETRIPSSVRDSMHNDELSDEEIMRSWNAVKRTLTERSNRTEVSVCEDEYAVLSNEENSDSGSFSSYSSDVPDKYREHIDQIAVVDRLTVTQALIGFTRITRDDDNIVPLSQYPKKWLPAVELTGEGIFIRFNNEKIKAWAKVNRSRYRRMRKALQESNFRFDGFSETYVLLHTFAHLFIREISNVCGYSAASIREKIYSETDARTDEVKMCGTLIYVSSSDSDCSLGGLINIAHNSSVFEKIMDNMLERASWCSGDPLCISSTRQGYKNLNYSACHDCTLLPETSCERFNCFLDRAAVVGTPENPELGFFSKLL